MLSCALGLAASKKVAPFLEPQLKEAIGRITQERQSWAPSPLK